MIKDNILSIMPHSIRGMMERIGVEKFNQMEEIRLRVGQPLLITVAGKEYGLDYTGTCDLKRGYKVIEQDVSSVLKFISGFSLYALEDEIRQGYITIEGGHRIGIVGKAVVEKNSIKTLKYMSALNIRIAHEVIGCSDKILPYLFEKSRLCHTLIVSPPKCGKTTILRDLIRNLSNGFYAYGPFTVGVVDERSEIAGCYMGVPQNDIGTRTDVLDGCPKVEGMHMLLRSMSPQVIAVDEIGKKEDMLALEEVLGAGVSILCTVHGMDLDDCYKKPILKEMIDQGLFERIVVLGNYPTPGVVKGIFDVTNQFKVLR
ncbi:MAG: stage III sporulation protein AA [Cellulosilyticaceae bacterium]